jgi:hypothetical protein
LSAAIDDKGSFRHVTPSEILGLSGGDMNNIATVSTNPHEEEDHPLIRAAYALGVSIFLFGTLLPHGERWSACGIALIAFTYFY